MMQFLAVLFFGLMMAGGYPCCCKPNCHCCSLTSPPTQAQRSYTITFSGVVNAACGTCNDWNTTAWIVDSFAETGAYDCIWEQVTGLPCTFDRLEFKFACNAPGTGIGLYSSIVRIFEFSDGGQDGVFRIALSSTSIDCTAPGAQTYFGAISNNIQCDWSGATCNVA